MIRDYRDKRGLVPPSGSSWKWRNQKIVGLVLKNEFFEEVTPIYIGAAGQSVHHLGFTSPQARTLATRPLYP